MPSESSQNQRHASIEKYAHGHDQSVLRSHSMRSATNSCAYFLDRVKPGYRILDIGCGPGSITFDLAELVSENGYVLGIDFSESAIATANQVRDERGLSNVEFIVGDLFDLPVTAHSFDIVHAHQVLQHVADPIAALRAMAGYCKSDGIIVARDADYDGMIWHPASAGLDRWREVYSTGARKLGGEPNAGRYLRSWAIQAGLLVDLSASSTWTYSDDASQKWWGFSQADRVRNSAFTTRAQALGLNAGDIEEIALAWENWGNAEGGWFCMPHGEIIARPVQG